MAHQVLFPSAVDFVRVINTNAVDNLLAGKASYAKLPSLYQRAYMLVHETGEVAAITRFAAPEETPPEPKYPLTIDPRSR